MVTGGKISVTKINQNNDYWNKKREESNKEKDKSSSSKSSKAKSDKEEQTALEKFQDWFSRLFDWIEIRLERQADKIEKYTTNADRQRESGKYTDAIKSYNNAISATTTQMAYQSTAQNKYQSQANQVLDQAVANGLISQEGTDALRIQVAEGTLDIEEYSDEMQEVIKDYQEWYNKSREAGKALSELHNNIRTYVNDMKEVADAQRQAKLDKLDTYNTIGGTNTGKSYMMQNANLSYSSYVSKKKDSAYNYETKQLSKISTTLGNNALNEMNGAGISDTWFSKAVSNAEKAVKSKKKISSNDLKTLKKFSQSAYEKAYAYNLSLDNLESAKLEQALNYAQNSNERYSNKYTKYENNNSKSNDRISLLKSQQENKKSLKNKDILVNSQMKEYTKIMNNDNSSVATFSKDVASATKKINKKNNAKGISYNSASSKERKAVDKCIKNVRKYVKSKKAIAGETLANVGKYYSKGYISASFYQSCVNYNNALDNKTQAIAQAEIDKQTVIQEKQAVAEQKVQIIKDDYANKDSKTNNKIDLINAKASNANGAKAKNSQLKLLAGQYDTIVKNDKAEISSYSSIIKKTTSTINKNAQGSNYKKLGKKGKNSVNKLLSDIRKLVKSKKEISGSLMDKLATYYTKGYITANFYDSCLKYNEAYQAKIEAETQLEVDKQTAISEKENAGKQMLENVQQEYDNKLNTNSNKNQSVVTKQELKTTKGLSLNEEDYNTLIVNSKEKQKIYEDEAKAIQNQIQQNIKDGLWTTESQAYKDAVNSMEEYANKAEECKVEQEKWNNSIAEIPYNDINKALEKLDAIKNNYDSLLDIEKAKGAIQTAEQYQQQIANLNNQLQETITKRDQKYTDYQKALANPEGVYGGKDAETLYTEYLKLDTEVNNVTKNIVETNNALSNLPIDTLERAISLIEVMKSNYEAIISLDKAKGKDQTLEQYQKQIEDTNSEIEKYTALRNEAQSNYSMALSEENGAYAGKTADEWLEDFYKYDTQIVNLNKDIVEISNSIAQMPYDKIEQALNLIQKKNSNADSLWDIDAARGLDKTAEQYKKEIAQINDEIDQYTQEKNQKWLDYQKALANPEGVYGGQKAEEILGDYYDYDTKINGLRKDIVETNNAMAQIPYDVLEKELSLLDSISSNYESIISIDTAKGLTENIDQYQTKIEQASSKIEKYTALKAQAWNDYQLALANEDNVYGGKSADEFLKDYYSYDKDINTLTADIIENNNAILNMPLNMIEKALNLVQDIKANFESILSINEAMGIEKTKTDYLAQIENANAELSKYQEERNIAWENYQKALADSDGAYAGKTADDWLSQYYEFDTQVNNTKKDIIESNNAIAQLPYNTIEKAIQKLENFSDYYTSEFDLKQKLGLDLTESDYLGKMKDNTDKIKEYSNKQQQAYADYLTALADPNKVYGGKSADEYLEMYYEAGSQINNLKADNEDLKDSLRDDVYWRTFERAHDSAQRFADILSGVSNLIDDDMMFNSDGELTDFGVTRIANITSQYETARKEVQNYSEDIKNLNELYSAGYYTQDEYNSKLAELQKSMLDSASNMKSYIDDIKNTYKDMEQSEMDNLFKLIDLRNEALSAKKSYYDFDKTIKSKNKDIQAIQAQISALEDINTAEAKAKRAELQADLQEKQDDLNDTIQEHMFELSQTSLDELKNTLQDAFDDRWEDISSNLGEMVKLMATANELTESSTATIEATMNSLLSYYGINPVSTGIRGYASGTRSVDKNKIAWTSENGQEMIIRASDGAVLTPLKQGDIIPNADLSRNLFEWGALSPQNMLSDLSQNMNIPVSQNGNNDIVISPHYDALLKVEGNVDKNALPELKEILKQSYEYTTREIARDARKAGIKI